jgi:hypothetical protein
MNMLFEIDQDYEIKSPLMDALVPRGKKLYPIVELKFNMVFFILRIFASRNPDDEDEIIPMHTFLIDSIDQILSIVNDENWYVHTLSIFLPYGHLNITEDTICSVAEIFVGKESSGQDAYLYILKNGKKHLESIIGSTEDEVSRLKCIYKCNSDWPIDR